MLAPKPRDWADPSSQCFADELSYGEDNQCERMWVQVTGYDDNGNYAGTFEKARITMQRDMVT